MCDLSPRRASFVATHQFHEKKKGNHPRAPLLLVCLFVDGIE